MKMRNNKVVLPLIIILLIAVLPFGAIGLSNKVISLIRGENPEHLHKLNNKLYYYDASDKLIGTYECNNANCDDAVDMLDEDNFYYYRGGDIGKPLGVFSSEYVFVQDGDEIVLSNISIKKTIGKYKAFKNYGTLIAGSYIILQNTEDQFNLFSIENCLNRLSNFYDYIGISDSMINKPIEELKILVRQDNSWYIIDTDEVVLSGVLKEPAYNYDDNYVYLKKEDGYKIYNYQLAPVLSSVKIKDIAWLNDYIVITNGNGDILLYSNDLSSPILKSFKKTNLDLSFELKEDGLYVYDSNDQEVGIYNFTSPDENTEPIEPEENEDITDDEAIGEEEEE